MRKLRHPVRPRWAGTADGPPRPRRRHSLFKPAYVHPGAGGHKSDALQLSQIGTLFGRKGVRPRPAAAAAASARAPRPSDFACLAGSPQATTCY